MFTNLELVSGGVVGLCVFAIARFVSTAADGYSVEDCAVAPAEQKAILVTCDEFCALLYALGVQIARDRETLALPFFVDVDERALLTLSVERAEALLARFHSGARQ